MTLADFLLLPLYLLVFLVPVAGWVLTKNALRHPRIDALTFAAAFVDAVAVLIVTYLLAVINNFAGSPIPPDFGRIILRLVIVALGLISLFFLQMYRSGRFGAKS